MALGCFPITFLKCLFLAFFFCSYFVSKTPALSCDPRDSLALKEFADNLTNGSIVNAWSNSSDCCRWDGVVCENATHAMAAASRVTKLILSHRFLKGTISPSLARLDELKWLDLSINNLHGELPAEFSKSKQLKYLDLSQNAISGSVSTTLSSIQSIEILNISSNMFGEDLLKLGNLGHIVVFNISNNSFAGIFSSQICSSSSVQIIDISMNHFSGGLEGLENCSTSLKQLHFDGNLFSGPLPQSLYSLSALQQLTVSANSFSGQLSEKLSRLPNLETLVVSGNNFSGDLPNVFGNLTRLQRLCAHSNSFSGQLPSTLALCVELQVLDLRNNSLSGPVNLNFTNLQNLQTLDLASNHFTGPFPDSVSHCNNLTTLSLAKNKFNGSVPEIANLTSLSFLSVSNNSFSNLSKALTILQNCKGLTTLILTRNFHGEEMPVSVSGFESLVILALGNCGLQGTIPSWISKCRRLEVLDLSWNHLGGSIPPWIGHMGSLFYLDLSNNSLTGYIPTSFADLRNLISANCSKSNFAASASIPLFVKRNQSANGLQYNHASSFPPSIFLNNNRLSGIIFPDIGQLKGLHVLDLSKNNLTGIIPSSISEMENLEILDLSSNVLDGSIPSSFNKLTFLSKFNVAYNHLQGEIPTGGQFSSFPTSSFEGNLGLCGETYSSCKEAIGPVVLKPHVVGSANKFGRVNILGIMISVVIAVALLAAVVIFRISRRDIGDPITDFDEEFGSLNKLSEALGSSKLVLFQNSDCKDLTVAELLKSTNYFNQANIIGCGGFGLVYKASLPNGTKAAIKRLSGDCGQMEREFQAEVESLSRAQHKNLVSLKGYCQHGNDRLLIYSYLENGSLDYWLHECVDESSVLKWDTRLKIAQGAAHGLAYLHKSCEPIIVHRDVKSSNILLDERFEAHLADFGLSRLLQPYDTHVTTDLVGTLGYIPPEYSQTSTATCRGDVYSFGVVLLELLTGRRPVEVCKGKNCRDIVSWVFQMKSENREDEVFDSGIWHKDHKKQLLDVLTIACKCINQDPRKRPSIVQVMSWLDGVGASES